MSNFRNYLTPGRKGHLVGIGGVSMAPLAEVLFSMGLTITGSDISESEKVQHLKGLGIRIYQGHHKENIESDTEFVVRTAAVHDDNPEIMEEIDHKLRVKLGLIPDDTAGAVPDNPAD